MSLNFKTPSIQELAPRITVFGVGGAGGNAVNNMIRAELQGVEFVVANTDAQALAQSRAARKIQMGMLITQGLGAGARPEVGRSAAEEAMDEIQEHLQGSHMVFITGGMGGGTGTGAAPVIARAAKEQGILTVGVVTKPFQFEGAHRMRQAEAGVAELQQWVDTLIVIPNQNLFRVANDKTTFAQAFAMADEVLHSGVRGITDLMVMPGLINLDFADVRTIMNEMGKAMMGTGEASGERRALDAAEAAIANPLLDEVSMKGAKGVLIHITGGMDLTLFEVDEAANRIRSEVDPEANIIIGSTFNEALDGRMRVSLVATGIDAAKLAPGAEGSERKPPTVVTQFPRPAAARSAAPQPKLASAKIVSAASVAAMVSQPILPEPVTPAAMGAAEEEELEALEFVEEELPAIAAIVQDLALPKEAQPALALVEPSFREDLDAAMKPAPLAPSSGPNPFAEADLANASSQPAAPPAQKRKRSTGLLARITGLGRQQEDGRPTPNRDRMPSLGTPQPLPHLSEPRGLRAEPSDRLGLGSDEDQLDIPAFLRRQAN